MSFIPSQYTTFSVISSGVPVMTAGSPVDMGIIAIPPGLVPWVPVRATAYSLTTGGTMVDASYQIRTAAAGAGVGIMSGTWTMPFLTTTGNVQRCDGTGLLSGVFETSLYIRQLTNSANTGSIVFTVNLAKVGL
mgnify:CR=1 FL=1